MATFVLKERFKWW